MDIKISLEIGLSPALEGFLGKFLGAAPKATPAGHNDDAERQALQDERTAATERGEGPQPQGEAQRRTRRTKEQMAADAAAAATAQSNNQGGTPESGTADPSTTGQTATTDASPSDLAAALGVEEPKTESHAGATKKADVAAKMTEVMKVLSPKKMQDAMIEHLNGAKNLSTLDPKDYAAAIELFDKIIAG